MTYTSKFSERNQKNHIGFKPVNLLFDHVGGDAYRITAGTDILYTVPENKILHVIHTFFNLVLSTSGTVQAFLRIYDDVPAKRLSIYEGTVRYQNEGHSLSDAYTYPLILFENESIRSGYTGAVTARLNAGFIGVLENV